MIARFGAKTFFGLPAFTCLGILGVFVSFLGSAILNTLVMPWLGTADSAAHMDYVYQVHRGHLPAPYGYVWDHPGLAPAIERTDRQWASAHPPLFYYLASLVAGPFMDSGEWAKAIAATRLLNVGFGALIILTLAWAGWQLGGRRRAVLAVALPAIGALVGGTNRFTGNEYNDTLVSLISIVSITLAALILRDGLSLRRLIPLFPLAALGMATKASYIVCLALVLAAVILAPLLPREPSSGDADIPRPKAPFHRRLIVGSSWAAGIVVFTLATVGWIFLRNHRLSGSWFRSTPKTPVPGRVEHSLWDILSSDNYYLIVPRSLLGLGRWTGIWRHNTELSLAIAAVCVLLLLARLATKGRWKQFVKITPMNAVWLMLLLHLVGLYAAQLQQAIGWGAFNYRYFQPATLTITLILAVGLTAWRKVGPALLTILLSIMAVAMVGSQASFLIRSYPKLGTAQSVWTGLENAARQNELPAALVPIAISCLVIGVAITAVGLQLAARPKTQVGS